MILGKQIKSARILLGINQDQLSLEVNIPIATLRRIENCEVITSSATTLDKILKFFHDRDIIFIDDDINLGVLLKK